MRVQLGFVLIYCRSRLLTTYCVLPSPKSQHTYPMQDTIVSVVNQAHRVRNEKKCEKERITQGEREICFRILILCSLVIFVYSEMMSPS